MSVMMKLSRDLDRIFVQVDVDVRDAFYFFQSVFNEDDARVAVHAFYVELKSCHSFCSLRRREFETTETLDIAIARPAKTGFRSHPVRG